MSFLKRKVAVTAVVLSVVLSIATLGNSLIYAMTDSYKNWKQYGSSWSSMTLGTSGDTVADSGCAVTSAAILMVQSGSVTSEDFTPATIITYLNQNNGFTASGAILWTVLTSYAPTFEFMGGYVLSGSQEDKARTIQNFLEEGYYVIAVVKNGGHFVAIDSVDGSEVTMMDPGSSSTSLFDKYDASGVTQLRLFKGANSDEVAAAFAAQEEQPEDIEMITTTAVPETTTSMETTTTEVRITGAAITTKAATESTTTSTSTTTTTSATTTSTTTTAETTSTTGAETMTEAVVTTTMLGAAPETTVETIPVETTTTVETVEIVMIVNAPETAPGEEVMETASVQTMYIPEEQAEAVLFQVKDRNMFMTVRFCVQADLCLREEANTDSAILAVIPAGTYLDVVEVDEEFHWGKVAFEGQEGWISLYFTEL